MSQKTVLLDTNVIIRFLLNDHEKLSKKAGKIFKKIIDQKIEAILNHVTTAEVYYVLYKVYELPKKDIVGQLNTIINLGNINIDQKYLILKTLYILEKYNIPFVDAYNLLFALAYEAELKTFDIKLRKLYKRLKKEFI